MALQHRLGASLQSLLGEPAPAPKPQSGFFADGGMGRYIAGAIGDALMQNAGMQPVFAPMQRDKAQAAQEEAQWTRRRQASREDKQWEWQNKPDEAPATTEFERMLLGSGIAPGSPQWTEMMGKRVQRQLDEPEAVVPLPDGRIYIGPRSGIGAAIQGAGATQTPPAPVGRLRPIGGPTQPASGTFRR